MGSFDVDIWSMHIALSTHSWNQCRTCIQPFLIRVIQTWWNRNKATYRMISLSSLSHTVSWPYPPGEGHLLLLVYWGLTPELLPSISKESVLSVRHTPPSKGTHPEPYPHPGETPSWDGAEGGRLEWAFWLSQHPLVPRETFSLKCNS